MALLQRFFLPQGASAARPRKHVAICASSNGDRSRSSHGNQFDANNKQRRRGRPAYLRSPYDSPLRDGNRDRLIGLLTERATKTLMVYLMETNVNVYSWLVSFYKENPIPKNGSWDEVSGEAFLRKLLSMPIEEAKYNTGRDSLFDNVQGIGVDPRSIAQRIMDIRTQLSDEFIQDLRATAEENSILLRETLQTSFSSTLELPDTKSNSSSSTSSNANKSSSVGRSSTGSSPAGTRPGSPERKPDLTSHRPSFKTPTPAAWRRNRSPDSSRPGSPSSITGSSGTYSLSRDDRPAAEDPEQAAAVAALNAALNASLPSDADASHPELADAAAAAATGGSSGSSGAGDADTGASETTAAAAAAAGGDPTAPSDDKVHMKDAIAKLKRSLDVDVALLTNWGSPTEPVADSSPKDSSDINMTAGLLEDEPALSLSTDELAASAAAFEADSAAAAMSSAVESPILEHAAPEAVAEAADADDVSSSSSVDDAPQHLPKGWGPRPGLGFEQTCNNIVSLKTLAGKAVAAGVDAATVAQQPAADEA